jgi:hypothetical protein
LTAGGQCNFQGDRSSKKPMSDPEAKGRIPGYRSLVNRAVNRAIAVSPVILNFKETKARADAFFYECLAEPDTKSFLLHLLGYTTAIFDNAAEFRLLFVNAYPEIEASYVPDLQSFVDPLLNNVRLYARPRCDPSGLKVYLFWVWTRLAARIEHWKAEALHKIAGLESADAQSFERKVALHMERAEKKAYEQDPQAKIKADRSTVTGDRQPQHLALDPSASAVLAKTDCVAPHDSAIPDSESRAASKSEPVPPEQMTAFETADGQGAHSTGTMTKQMIVPRVKVGRRPKDQTRQIADLWEKMGCPGITAVVCDKIGKKFFKDELKERQPGSPEHKRVRERVRKAIERSCANAQHN